MGHYSDAYDADREEQKLKYKEEEVGTLIKKLKDNPNLFLYDYNLTDLVRYLLIKVEDLESKTK